MREAFKRSADGTHTPSPFVSSDRQQVHFFEPGYDRRLCLDLSAIISRHFRESSGKRQADAECLRRAFTVTRRGLKRGKAALMNVSTVYWEAVAAGCETEVKLRTPGLWVVEDGLRRWAILMDQLFSISVVTLLEGWSGGEDPAEFIRTVTAIAEALGKLAAEADHPRKNTVWAYSMLGMQPDAPPGEVKKVYQNLLTLWEPAAAADTSAGGRQAAVKEAYALLKERERT